MNDQPANAALDAALHATDIPPIDDLRTQRLQQRVLLAARNLPQFDTRAEPDASATTAPIRWSGWRWPGWLRPAIAALLPLVFGFSMGLASANDNSGGWMTRADALAGGLSDALADNDSGELQYANEVTMAPFAGAGLDAIGQAYSNEAAPR